MMDMMIADVAGKPAQNSREIIKRAAFHGCTQRIPRVFAGPVTTFKLVLHVKKLDTDPSCQPQHRQLDEDVGPPSNNTRGNQSNGKNEQVGQNNAHAFLPFHP